MTPDAHGRFPSTRDCDTFSNFPDSLRMSCGRRADNPRLRWDTNLSANLSSPAGYSFLGKFLVPDRENINRRRRIRLKPGKGWAFRLIGYNNESHIAHNLKSENNFLWANRSSSRCADAAGVFWISSSISFNGAQAGICFRCNGPSCRIFTRNE